MSESNIKRQKRQDTKWKNIFITFSTNQVHLVSRINNSFKKRQPYTKGAKHVNGISLLHNKGYPNG